MSSLFMNRVDLFATYAFNFAEGRNSLVSKTHPLSPTLKSCHAVQNVKDVLGSFFSSAVYPTCLKIRQYINV